MPDAIQLVIVTPERQLLSQIVWDVTLPGAEGELGVLPVHAPLITELGIGTLSFRPKFPSSPAGSTPGEAVQQEYDPKPFREHVAIIRGFAEVLGDRVTVLAETAERPEEIDVERAKAALERAEKRIAAGPGTQEIDWDRATAALQRAMVRLKVAEYAPKRRSAMVPGQ
ncbi:MAG TPA: ATP synthase delta/epsilon chain alpha-helix domain-containing protein [Candidatus Acidoferrum sp.]|nr:ATP synthase delta/epsilon chain alpha-helix domain-containing protein [Candidatus Acidoferrum sp.]